MRIYIGVFLAGLIAFVAGVALAQLPEGAIAPRRGVILLQNGELLSGTVSVVGDRLNLVDRDTETFIKRADVAAVCSDAHECYLYKRRGMELGRVQDHVELAQWCLTHGLLDEAAAELHDARAADATHPKIDLLARRLELAQDAKSSPEPPAAIGRTTPVDPLDRVTRTLPIGAMETFTNTIQPLLLNHCTKSGCHGQQSTTALRLERMPLAKPSGRRPTQRNLQAALSLIDTAHPNESPLLDAPIRPHGNMAIPIFTSHDHAQYRQLVQWVYLVAGVKSSAPLPSLAGRGGPLLQTVRPNDAPAGAGGNSPQPVRQASNWAASFPDQQPGAVQASAIGPASPASGSPREEQPKGSAPRETYTPRDPFDPEIFNRRFSDK